MSMGAAAYTLGLAGDFLSLFGIVRRRMVKFSGIVVLCESQDNGFNEETQAVAKQEITSSEELEEHRPGGWGAL